MSLEHGEGTRSGRLSKEYRAWRNMRNRCINPRATHYKEYGGRGITVCERWSRFAAFLQDMGRAPAGATLDRINNDGNYEPGNCRWASRTTQSRNRRNVRSLTLGGVTRTLPEWCEIKGIAGRAVLKRLARGWSDEDALTREMRAVGGNK